MHNSPNYFEHTVNWEYTNVFLALETYGDNTLGAARLYSEQYPTGQHPDGHIIQTAKLTVTEYRAFRMLPDPDNRDEHGNPKEILTKLPWPLINPSIEGICDFCKFSFFQPRINFQNRSFLWKRKVEKKFLLPIFNRYTSILFDGRSITIPARNYQRRPLLSTPATAKCFVWRRSW